MATAEMMNVTQQKALRRFKAMTESQHWEDCADKSTPAWPREGQGAL